MSCLFTSTLISRSFVSTRIAANHWGAIFEGGSFFEKSIFKFMNELITVGVRRQCGLDWSLFR